MQCPTNKNKLTQNEREMRSRKGYSSCKLLEELYDCVRGDSENWTHDEVVEHLNKELDELDLLRNKQDIFRARPEARQEVLCSDSSPCEYQTNKKGEPLDHDNIFND